MRNLDDILNLITGNLAQDQKRKVLSDIRQEPDSEDLYRKAKTTWALMSSTQEMSIYRIEQSYRKLDQRISSKQHIRHIFFVYTKYVAGLILFIGIPALMYFLGKSDLGNQTNVSLRYTSVVAEKGHISKVILPDSSIVWLNSETTLTYDNNYSRSNRNLKLSGQAFLDVRKNKNLPLVVSCANLMVKVLGTRFDVKAYPDDKEVNVILESGRIELLSPVDKSFNYRMVPGQRASYDTKAKTIDIESIEIQTFPRWEEGILRFTDTPMKDVIKILKRKYDVEFEVTDSKVYRSVFNATFKNESLKEILDYISYSCHINYRLVKENSRTKVILY